MAVSLTVPADVGALYRVAFLDWLACACAGAGSRAAVAARASGAELTDDVAFAATAGHVLDFDDTLPAGVVHVSAPTAPAALLVAAALGRSVGDALGAYAEGYEAMGAVAIASHPALYDRGWHPTAVCGPVGAVVAASRLLELSDEEQRCALAIGMLRAGGARGAFGSDGKALQVGLAAAAGVQAALLARGGARVEARAIDGQFGVAEVTGAVWPAGVSVNGAASPGSPGAALHAAASLEPPAIAGNWIKLHPSCLGTHSPIDAAAQLRDAGAGVPARVEVMVNPVARQAAHLDAVDDGLSAKFSIPYCVAHTLLHGPPRRRDFDAGALDVAALGLAERVAVRVDDALPEWGAALRADSRELVRVSSPRGSAEHPVSADELGAKVADLAGDRLRGALDDLDASAADVARAAGLVGGS